MCGIAGFFGQQNNNATDIIQAMTQQQAHRGPNAEGFLVERIKDKQIALGHRRLSIIDISDDSNQPMSLDYLTLVYNGEVYNYREIKKELEKAGHSFQTSGDTEVILKAFREWGVDSIKRFRGMFSLCILDKREGKAYLIRDRVGVKPLYYYVDNNLFIFSSELKSLHQHPQFKGQINQQGLHFYLQHGYIVAPETIFQHTKKVCPGHYLEYDLTTHTMIEKKYWDLSSYYILSKSILDEQEAIVELEKILIDSFSLRMVSDVPVGVLLSGGIDSSLVASLLQSHSNQTIDTFTIGFEQSNYDESVHAKKVADYLGTHHHEKICTWQDAQSIIPHLPQMYDEPFADSSAIPTALVSQMAKKNVAVVLSGDGGDELFCGYSYYALNQARFDKINQLPFKKMINKVLHKIPDPIMSLYRYHFDSYNRYLKFKSVMNNHQLEAQFKSVTQTFTNYDIKKMLLDNPIYHHYDMPHNLHAMEKMMLLDFQHYLPDDLLVKVDRATMFYSLEGREPLLDHTILEYAAQLPMQLKANKYILKKILAKYLPTTYFERKKQGFGLPINNWLRKDLKYLLDKYLNKAIVKKQDIFNSNYVAQLCKSFHKSKTNDPRVWTLLMFQMWYEKYIGENF